MASEPSIPLNAKTIGLFMAIIGALTFGWNVVSYFKTQELKNFEQDMRLDRTDRDRERNIKSLNDLTSKTGELKEAVVKLTTVLETNTKKAEGPRDVTVQPADFVIKEVQP